MTKNKKMRCTKCHEDMVEIIKEKVYSCRNGCSVKEVEDEQ